MKCFAILSSFFALRLAKTDAVASSSIANATQSNLRYSNDLFEKERELTLNVLNLSYQQPFSTFFVLVHNSQAAPLYTLGQPASNELARLAESGQAGGLENYYANVNPTGVKTARRFFSPVTYGGETSQIRVCVSIKYTSSS